jgi:hypothetical protein
MLLPLLLLVSSSFSALLYEEGLLLTSNLGLARQGYEPAAVPITTATNEKRFRKLLFLGLTDVVI